MAKNRHHIFWPKKDYQSGIERSFRNLPCNVVWIDQYNHNLLHQYTRPPSKPSHHEMCEAINRHRQQTCSCYH
jgi:hypothetical protein